MVTECGEVQFFSDFLHHLLIVCTVRIGVVGQYFVGDAVPFPVAYDSAGNQIQFRVGTGKVQVGAAKHKRRAGRPDMDLLRTALIQELRGLTQLCAADDGIVDQQHAFAAD